MKQEKKGKKIKMHAVVLTVIAILCLSVVCFVSEVVGGKETPIDKMDRCEKRYDADGPLVMINARDGIIGFYNATTPLKHMECDIRVDANMDVGEIILNSERVIFTSAKNYIVLPLSQDDIDWVYENISDWTPAIIYIV